MNVFNFINISFFVLEVKLVHSDSKKYYKNQDKKKHAFDKIQNMLCASFFQ